LRVAYTGTTDGVVRLFVDDVSGRLAADLRLDVAVGDGGSFAGCAGFTGFTFYRGPLAGMAAGSGTAPGVSSGWRPVGGQSRTFRVAVTVSSSSTAQRESAGATFRWLPEPDTGRTPRRAVSPAPGGTPSRSPTSDPGLGGSPSAGPGSVSGGGSVRADQEGRLATVVDRFLAVSAAAAQLVLELTVRTAKHGGFPVGSTLAVLAFLLVQDRLDRRDPKLALAPLSADERLAFPEDEFPGRPDLHDDELPADESVATRPDEEP